MMSVGIVGAGRVGSALARALAAAGLPPLGINDVDPSAAQRAADEVGVPALSADRLLARCELVVLACPDDLIAETAAQLAALSSPAPSSTEGTSVDGTSVDAAVVDATAVDGTMAPRSVVHCSGALDTAALSALAEAGWDTGAWHPLQAFPTTSSRIEPGITWAITAAEPLAARLDELSRALGGLPLRLAAEAKPLYHAAAVLASNYLVTLAAHAAGLLTECGLDDETALPALVPLMRSSLTALQEAGLPQGLTGPLARGDLGTIATHLAALKDFPQTLSLYRAAGVATIPLLTARGLPVDIVERTERLLSETPFRPGK